MDRKQAQREQRAQVAQELGGMIRRQARRKWSTVRTAERNEPGHHVWRFRPGADAGERFLHVSHKAMEQAENSSRLLFEQLRAGRWLDRLANGPETALRLSAGGQVEAWPPLPRLKQAFRRLHSPPSTWRRSMLPFRAASELRIEDFQVSLEDRPGWVWGNTRVPRVGEEIFCAAGVGTVRALHGKTGNGSRLVQIALASAPQRPFFAAASNVLLPPVGGDLAEELPMLRGGAAGLAEPDAWLRGSGSATGLG